MARNFSTEEHKAGLTLIVKPADDPERPVDAERFLQTASKWLASLDSFALDVGLKVRWEIAELKRSSALLEIVPVNIATGLIASSIAENWNDVVREIERTGTPPVSLQPATLRDLEQFVTTTNDLAVTVRVGDEPIVQTISANTQKRLKDAIAALPSEEYTQEGTIRGTLAVLNSWNPRERWFRLKLPLVPDKQVRCAYSDENLIAELGDTFEKTLDVKGILHYRRSEAWPFFVDVASVSKLPDITLEAVEKLIQPIVIPHGLDSVSYIRSVRDAE